MAQKSISSQSYKRSKYRHKVVLLSLFYKTASLFWFSLFFLPLSGFWPFSFSLKLLLHIHNLQNVTGGYDGDNYYEDILEYKDGGGWRKVGEMQNGRNYHGLSPVNFNDFANYCNN